MAPKMKTPGYNFRGCWLTMQNESIIMPNLRILFSQMFGQLQNPQKICPAKISRYTVVHDERLLTEAKDTYIAVFIQH